MTKLDLNLRRSDLGVIVLAGGKSSRMGCDKRRLLIHGQTFLDRIVSTFRSAELPVVVASQRDSEPNVEASSLLIEREESNPASPVSLMHVYDERENVGPLEGIRIGLQALESVVPFAFVVNCDSPLVCVELAALLLAEIGEHEAAVPALDGMIYGTTAVYRTGIHRKIDQALQQGIRSVKQMVAQLDARFVDDSKIRSIDPALNSLINVNTPEDYERLISQLEQGQPDRE